MIETKLRISTGEEIFVYDNVFTSSESSHIQNIIEGSYFKLGTRSYRSVNCTQTTFFQSKYNLDDVEKLGFKNNLNYISIFNKHLKNYNGMTNTWVNASTYLTDYRFHVDKTAVDNGLTQMYYANEIWDDNWGGETIFKNNNNEVEIAISYKPNRIVIFNSHISHKPTNLSVTADMYRFILVTQFQ